MATSSGGGFPYRHAMVVLIAASALLWTYAVAVMVLSDKILGVSEGFHIVAGGVEAWVVDTGFSKALCVDGVFVEVPVVYAVLGVKSKEGLTVVNSWMDVGESSIPSIDLETMVFNVGIDHDRCLDNVNPGILVLPGTVLDKPAARIVVAYPAEKPLEHGEIKIVLKPLGSPGAVEVSLELRGLEVVGVAGRVIR